MACSYRACTWRIAGVRRDSAVCGGSLGRTVSELAVYAGATAGWILSDSRRADGGAVSSVVADFSCDRDDLRWRGNLSCGPDFQSSGTLAECHSDVGDWRASRMGAGATLVASHTGGDPGAVVAGWRMGSADGRVPSGAIRGCGGDIVAGAYVPF